MNQRSRERETMDQRGRETQIFGDNAHIEKASESEAIQTKTKATNERDSEPK